MPNILLTGVIGPHGNIQFDLAGDRLTRDQDIFTTTSHFHYVVLHFLAQNLASPCVVLEHPSLEDFEEEFRKGYDFVGINFTLVNIVKTMQWLDPHPLEEEWEAALARGETEARDSAKLQEVLDRHELQLPLPSPDIEPKFRPGAIRVYK